MDLTCLIVTGDSLTGPEDASFLVRTPTIEPATIPRISTNTGTTLSERLVADFRMSQSTEAAAARRLATTTATTGETDMPTSQPIPRPEIPRSNPFLDGRSWCASMALSEGVR